MNAVNAHGYSSANENDEELSHYHQGQLDSLCGIYAMINACRMACRSPAINKQLGSRFLFQLMIQDLEAHKELGAVLCFGTRDESHSRCLAVAEKYLLCRHGLILTVTRPLAKITKPSIAHAFKIIHQHLQKPGSSVLLDLQVIISGHWTVISKIENGWVYFADSTGMKPKPFGDFGINSAARLRRDKKVSFSKSDLLLLQVTFAEGTLKQDISCKALYKAYT